MSMLFYASTIGLAFMMLTVHLYPTLTITELGLASIPVGTVGGAWLCFIVSLLLSFLSDESLTISAVIMAVTFLFYLDAFLAKAIVMTRSLAAEKPRLVALAPLLGVFTMIFAPLYKSRYFQEDQHGQVWTGGSTWADGPVHLTIASSFLYGSNRSVYWRGLTSPLFAGAESGGLRYPFLPDFHAAVLVKLGSSMATAMWVPGFLCFIASVGLLFLLAYRMLRGNRMAAALAVCIVIFAGGFAGVNLWFTNGLAKTLALDPIQDDVGAHGEVLWFSYTSHIMLPQRSATFAYPLVLFVMVLSWVAVEKRMGTITRGAHVEVLVAAAAITGALPLVQAHACIGLAFYVGAMAVLDLARALSVGIPALSKRLSGKSDAETDADLSNAGARVAGWALAGVVALAEAWPQIQLLSTGIGNQKFFSPEYILKGGVPGFFSSWWAALGPTVFLFFGAGVPLAAKVRAVVQRGAAASDAAASAADDVTKTGAAASDESAAMRPSSSPSLLQSDVAQEAVWYAAAAAVFLFSNFVLVQPWAKDNVKLIYIWLFAGSAFVARLVTGLLSGSWMAGAGGGANTAGARRRNRGGSSVGETHPVGLAVVAVLVFLMCFSGVLSVVRETQNNHVLFGRDETAVGEWFRKNTRTDAVVLHKDHHRAPSQMLAGRTSLVSYSGWMWTHGYPYHERHADREAALKSITKKNDSQASSLLYRWGVRYVVAESTTARKESIGEVFQNGHTKRVFQSGRFHVYRVKYDGEPF